MEAGRLGAADYLVKGEIDSSKLERSIRYAVQRAEASEAIRSNELKFRSLFEQSRDSIFIIRKRSEEHTSELQSLMRISYAVFCLKKKNYINQHNTSLYI